MLLLNSVIPSHVDTAKMGFVPHCPTLLEYLGHRAVTGWLSSSPWISNGGRLWMLDTLVRLPRMFLLSIRVCEDARACQEPVCWGVPMWPLLSIWGTHSKGKALICPGWNPEGPMCSSLCAVPGPESRVHVEIARLMKLYYLISFVSGETSVSLPKSWKFLKSNQSSKRIPKHWGSLKVKETNSWP